MPAAQRRRGGAGRRVGRRAVETPSPDTVEIVVEDNGTGPPQQQREHLFDPFYSGRSAGRGRGLGLPTAWRFARQHGGDVHFTRLPDGLTRFVLTLPADGLPSEAPQRPRLLLSVPACSPCSAFLPSV